MSKELQTQTSYGWLAKWGGDYHDMVPATVEQAFRDQNQISFWRNQEESYKILNAVILKMLKDIHPQTSEALLRIRLDIIKTKYWYFRIGEVALVLRNGITGKYGNIPSGADPVIYWLEQYDQGDRLKYCEAQALSHKESNDRYFEQKELEDTRKKTEEFTKAFERNLNQLRAKDKAQRTIADKTD